MGERYGINPEEIGTDNKKKKDKKVGIIGKTVLAASLMVPAVAGLAQKPEAHRVRTVNKTEQVGKTPEKKETEKHIIFVKTSAQGQEAEALRSHISKALESEGVNDAQIILELDGNANQFEKQAGIVRISWKAEVSPVTVGEPKATVGGVAKQEGKRIFGNILSGATGGRVSSSSIGGVIGTNNSPTRVSHGEYSLRGELSSGTDSDIYEKKIQVKAVSASGGEWQYFLKNGNQETPAGSGSDYRLSNEKLRKMTTDGLFEQKGNKILHEISEKFKNSPASTKR